MERFCGVWGVYPTAFGRRALAVACSREAPAVPRRARGAPVCSVFGAHSAPVAVRPAQYRSADERVSAGSKRYRGTGGVRAVLWRSATGETDGRARSGRVADAGRWSGQGRRGRRERSGPGRLHESVHGRGRPPDADELCPVTRRGASRPPARLVGRYVVARLYEFVPRGFRPVADGRWRECTVPISRGEPR